MKLGKLLEGAGVRYCLNFRDLDVLGVTDDSRNVRPGHLFVAVRGAESDGHRFLPNALAHGAGAVAVEDPASVGSAWPSHIPVAVVQNARRTVSRVAARIHGEPARRVRVIGVTGTNGKTTAAHYIRAILKSAGYRAGLMGTLGHDLDGRAAKAKNTTPGALDIHGFLRDMERSSVTFAVMEVSSHALDQERVADVPFASGVFTNLTSDHLDYHGTQVEYLKAKTRLFSGLAPDALAVLNADDWASAVFAGACPARKVRYGLGGKPDLRYRLADSGLWGSRIALAWRGRAPVEATIAMPGLHNAANAAAAAAFALGLGLPMDAVIGGLGSLTGVPGRLEEVPLGAPFKAFVDYAHTEDALRAVLKGLRAAHRGRLLLVFGAGGDRDKSKRPRMGRAAGELADHCWLTSDNPRSEDPDDVIRDIETGMPLHAWYAVEPDRRAAIFEALAFARPGDAVLVAGKGHETEQVIGRETRLFSDRDVIREAWASLGRERRDPAVPAPETKAMVA